MLKIDVSDNHSFIKKLKTKPFYDSKKAVEEELNNIVSSFRSEGYLLADVDSAIYDSLFCSASIHSGSKYKWAHLSKGNADDNLMAATGFHERMYSNLVFTPKEVSSLMEKILTYCDNNGYPFARVKLDSVVIEDNAISAQLKVTKHRLIKIDSFLVIGNANIKKRYLYRYLHIKEGDLYDEHQIRQIEQRIRQLPFVKQTKQQIVKITDKDTRLILFLDKKSASQFDGIIGLQPQPSGKTVLTGNVNIKLYNSIFRRGELFNLNWQRLQFQTQDFKSNVVYPYLFNTPLGVDYSLSIYKRDTTYIDIQNNIGIQYLFSGLNYFKVFFRQRNTNLLSTSALVGATTLPDYADIGIGSYGVSFFYEKLNYKFNPRSGVSINISTSAGSRNIHKNSKLDDDLYNNVKLNSTQYQVDANLACYIPLFKYSTIKMAFQGGSLNSPQLFTNELYRIGGFKSIRGIDEQSIYASSFGIGSIEYRFLFEQNSAFLLFADGGWYENVSFNNPNAKKQDTPYSVGAGVMFQTKAGVFQLNYAIGHQFNNDFSFRTGKINFGIVNTF
ncbi:MAG TPA: POTRA domain-containing protein [Bacteroidia bacterium]|nr:POTRA domain-containing protein [Bacteroidia bacterium]